MTENEAIDFLNDMIDLKLHGEITDSIRIAIKALTEIQQYRAIGTVEECRAAVEMMLKAQLKHGIGGCRRFSEV